MNAPLRDSAIRLSADVGGTFTDVAAFDETTGALRLGKTLTTPQRLVTGIENGVGKAGSQFAAARLFLHGTTVAINTILERSGAQMRAADHAGLPRHLRDRPRQPAGILQPVLPEARAADRPRSALRDHGADGLAGHRADPARRGAGADRGAGPRSHRACRPSPSCSCTRTATRRTSSARRRSSSTNFRSFSSPRRTNSARNTASTSALRPPRPTPMSARACSATSTEMESHLEDAGFAGNFLIVQSTGGLFDVGDARQSCIRMLESGPAAGVVGTKALCDSINISNAIAFDMGGTTAKAGVIYEGNVLMTGAALIGGYATGLARANADDRHPGGRHRRRQHRPRRGRQRLASRPGIGRAPRPARSATASAAPSRPSPTPIWCSAASAPTASSAARCRSISTRRKRR